MPVDFKDTKTLLSDRELKTTIDNTIKSSHSVATRIHFCAVQCLIHAEKHGSADMLTRLWAGLHAVNRPVALKDWAEKYAPIYLRDKDKRFCLYGKDHKKYQPFNIDAADADPYWTPAENKAGAEPMTLERLMKYVQQAINKAEKADKNGNVEDSPTNVVRMHAVVDRLKKAMVVAVAGEEVPVEPKSLVTTVELPTPELPAPEPVEVPALAQVA